MQQDTLQRAVLLPGDEVDPGMVDLRTIGEWLDNYARLEDAANALNLEYQEKREAILAPIRDQLDALDTELGPVLSEVGRVLAGTAEKIKDAVTANGASVKTDVYQAVYTRPRESVDMDEFRGYCVAHPDARALLKPGKASVSLRRVRKK